MSLDIQFVENFILAVDFFPDEVEVEVAAGAHQLSHVGLLEQVALDRNQIVGWLRVWFVLGIGVLISYAFSESFVGDIIEDALAACEHGYNIVIAVQLLLQNTDIYDSIIATAFLHQFLFGDSVEQCPGYFVIDFQRLIGKSVVFSFLVDDQEVPFGIVDQERFRNWRAKDRFAHINDSFGIRTNASADVCCQLHPKIFELLGKSAGRGHQLRNIAGQSCLAGLQLLQSPLFVDVVYIASATHHQILRLHAAERKSKIEGLQFYPPALVGRIKQYV